MEADRRARRQVATLASVARVRLIRWIEFLEMMACQTLMRMVSLKTMTEEAMRRNTSTVTESERMVILMKQASLTAVVVSAQEPTAV